MLVNTLLALRKIIVMCVSGARFTKGLTTKITMYFNGKLSRKIFSEMGPRTIRDKTEEKSFVVVFDQKIYEI